jgi:lysophospholipase L1-like esterase
VKIALATLAAALLVPSASGATAPTGGSIVALGDSITRAFDTCLPLLADCPQNSWSTGTSVVVNSWHQRIVALDPGFADDAYNDAETGAKMADLPAQAALAVAQQARVVTILMGANDVCTRSVSSMTDTTTLGNELRVALTTITSGDPTAQIYIVSIPNVYHLWQILHTNLTADLVWSLASICQSMLANPLSFAPADVIRRLRVWGRTVADNIQIAVVCASFAPACHYDRGAAFTANFTTSDVNPIDFFHPSLPGQAKLAAVAWTAFGGT